jgi:hypothetical protein
LRRAIFETTLARMSVAFAEFYLVARDDRIIQLLPQRTYAFGRGDERQRDALQDENGHRSVPTPSVVVMRRTS